MRGPHGCCRSHKHGLLEFERQLDRVNENFLPAAVCANKQGSSLFKTDQRFSEVVVYERGVFAVMLDVVLPNRASLSDMTAFAERIREF